MGGIVKAEGLGDGSAHGKAAIANCNNMATRPISPL